MSKLKVKWGGGKNLNPIKYLYLIIIYCIIITSGTYAYQYIGANNSNVTGTGGCFNVTYSSTEINNDNLISTTDYKESDYSTVTISKASSCKIYNYANIYIHTNNTTTAPINSVEALKYKVLTNDGYERNGFINTIGDTLIANVPITNTSTTYKVYLYVDSFLSIGMYNDTSYSGYIYAEATQTSTVDQDTTSPTLFLKKESYIEGFDGWTLTNSTVSNNILSLAPSTTSGSAKSPFINVDGEKWKIIFDGNTTNTSTSCNPKGCILVDSSYYDYNKVSGVKSIGVYTGNGYAPDLEINQWTNNISWDGYSGYSKEIKFLRITFSTGNQYSQPVTMVRNFKVYGQVNSSFYDIYVNSEDNIGANTIKYAKGEYDKSYFNSNGNIVSNNQVRVTENGTYTFYAKDTKGNSNITTIDITNIV